MVNYNYWAALRQSLIVIKNDMLIWYSGNQSPVDLCTPTFNLPQQMGWPKNPPKDIHHEQRCETAGRHPLSCVDNIKIISLKMLVILMHSSTILLIYIRSGLSAIFEAVVEVFWPRRCAPWPKISSDHQWCAHLLLSPSTHRHGALASLCCHFRMFVPLLHPLLLRACLFLVGCCVSFLFHWPPKSTIMF